MPRLPSFIEKFRETFVSENDVTEKIKHIENSVQLLQSHLSDAQLRQASTERMMTLERDMREIIYRFDNVKENFAIVAASRGGRFSRFFKRLVPVGLKDLREIYTEIREIDYRIDYLLGVSADLISISSAQLQGESSSAACLLSWRRYSGGAVDSFVGREEEIELLWSYIKEPQCRVIGICGMGGVGKTALARMLDEDERVICEFARLAWVCAPHDFKPETIFEILLTQLCVYPEGSIPAMDAAEMVQRLYKVQQEVRCLIVLDDLRSSDAWEALSVAFPSGNTRSKVIITTRITQVVETAETVAARRYIHKLRCLTQAEGCQLFMKNINKGFVDNELVQEIGKEMVKYWEGLPLAIIESANFLCGIPTSKWLKVRNDLQSFIRENLETSTTFQSLALSYNYLPHFLRPCFLYLGHLQEHSPIEAEELYLLWLAEGLKSLEGCGKEEIPLNVAERYLGDLAQRSMIEVQEKEVPTVTRFSSCHLNHSIRELCLVKNERQSFLKVVDFRGGTQHAAGSSSSYRLSMSLDEYEHKHDFQLKDDEKKLMRCLLISAKENQQELVWPHHLSSLLKFKNLGLLGFTGISFQVTQILEGIGNLVHLRYLSFKVCNLRELPSSIGNLKLLHILDLRVINTMIIPDVLWKLKNLKHLYFPLSFETHGAGKLRLDGLTDLETVTNFDVKMCNVRDLLKLYNLRYIALSVPGSLEEIECVVERMNMNSDVQFLRASLEVSKFDCYTKERISVLRRLLGCQSLIVLCLEGHIRGLPLHHEISSNLAKIVLVGSELMEDPMTTLQKLPKLRVLILDVDAFIGKDMTCSASGFIELRRLELLNLHYLEKWIVEDGAMLRLSTVAIVNCGKLIMLPEELQFVHRLQKMRVSGMCKEFKDSISMVNGMTGQSTYRVQHVPSITIED